jgi:Transposase DDE domain
MLTISQALQRIKGNVELFVPQTLVQRLVAERHLGQRQRTLPPKVTTYLFLQQILHGNTACSHLRHLSGLDFTDAAYCQARARLPFGFFHRLQNAVTGQCFSLDPVRPEERWHGHDVYLLDGSSYSMPDTAELRAEFGQPSGQKPGCGFPAAHLLLLCNATSGYIRKAVPAPLFTHDLSQVALLHPQVPRHAVVVGDRAFCSYAHLALCRQRDIYGVFRAHQKTIIDFRPGRSYAPAGMATRAAKGLPRSRWVRRLGKYDQLVEYFKPEERPAWMTPEHYAALPASLVVRELRYDISLPGRRSKTVTVVTTLLHRRRYSRRALALLYGLRWRVETTLKHLKTTLKMDVLRCQSLVGIMKELTMFITVYNVVRRVMREAGRRQKVTAERISFVDALRWLADSRPGDALPRLKVVSLRPHRVEPRVRKRRPKNYPLMQKPRAQLQQILLEQKDAA